MTSIQNRSNFGNDIDLHDTRSLTNPLPERMEIP